MSLIETAATPSRANRRCAASSTSRRLRAASARSGGVGVSGGTSSHRATRLSARSAVARQRRLLGREGGLRGREPRDRHAEGRAGDVVEPDPVEQVDRGGVAAVLSADAELELGPRGAAALAADRDELADALLVDRLEGVALD